MRLIPMDGAPGSWLAYRCARCGGRIQPNTGAQFDLDGPPFTAYYHAECARAEAAGELERTKTGQGGK